jgi:hypothetical protein
VNLVKSLLILAVPPTLLIRTVRFILSSLIGLISSLIAAAVLFLELEPSAMRVRNLAVGNEVES